MGKDSDIRGSAKQRIIGKCAGWLLRLVGSTLRIKITDESGLADVKSTPVLWALWHNTVFVMPYVGLKYLSHRKVVVLTSASKDGAVLENAVAVCKLGAVRGSSSRRAVAALVALKKAIKSGFDVCITPDGPRGPKYKLQGGIIKMSETTGAPIIPVRVKFESAWKLKTWDAFRIPKPFSKVHVVMGEPMTIPEGLNEDAFEESRLLLEQKMLEKIV